MMNKPTNTLAPTAQKQSRLSQYLEQASIKASLANSMGADKAQGFIAGILACSTTNLELQKCDYQTVVSAGMIAAALELPLSPQLGYCYLVPYEDRKNGRTIATFILGYKGYIQLAERSGQYRKLIVLEIKEGEFVSYDPLSETLIANINEDADDRDTKPTVGYYAMFELTNGFTKTMYWSASKMRAHALKYSPGYAADIRKKTNYTFWSQDFDGMAKKTMLRQLISKWGIMSVQMQKAFENDRDGDGSADNSLPDFNEPAPKNEIASQQESAEDGEVVDDEEADDLFGVVAKTDSET